MFLAVSCFSIPFSDETSIYMARTHMSDNNQTSLKQEAYVSVCFIESITF